MLGHREMSLEDYLGAFRRRKWIIFTLTLLGAIAGRGVVKLVTPTFTSEATVLVENPKVSSNIVKPFASQSIISRFSSMQEKLLSRTRLQPLILREGLYPNQRPVTADVVSGMRGDITVTLMLDFFNQNKKKRSAWDRLLHAFTASGQTKTPRALPHFSLGKNAQPIMGFTVDYTYQNPRVAQRVCNEITSMFLKENRRELQRAAQSTKVFLSNQLADAKARLDEQDAKLAAFESRNLGSLPDEQQSNLQVLATLNTQLGAVTDGLGRAEQDKAYVESLLQDQVATSKASQQTGPGTTQGVLEKQLLDLRQEEPLLEERYTSNYPDVIRMKAEIASLEKQVAEQAAADKGKPKKSTGTPVESPQIQKLQAQLYQDEEQIRIKGRDQDRLQSQIKRYEARVQLTPAVKQEYKQLTRNYKTALDFYNNLLSERDRSAMAADLEQGNEGEQFAVLNPANLPKAPSFPNPLMFLVVGLGVGMGLGLAIAVALELADKAIRSERDVELLLGLPALAMIPPLVITKRKIDPSARVSSLAAKQPAGGS